MLATRYIDIVREADRRYVSPKHGDIFGPNVSAYKSDRPGLWAVSVGVLGTGFSAHFDAVIDNFGDLVRVGRAIA